MNTQPSVTDPVVRVRDLVKTYPKHTAVDGVSFDIERGEVFALLGPNGAGKSTTIEILEGYRHRTSGEVSVLGLDPQRLGPGRSPTSERGWKARIGIVSQQTGENGRVTVREQLRHFATLYPNPRDPDEVIEAVGLTEKANTRISKLSGGQQRRVDVALGVIGTPELLFLDEPTTGFDPAARRQFWDLIRSLQREGTTILLTTHYLDEAAQLSDRAGVIAGGKMLEIAPISQLGGADARTPRVRWFGSDGQQHEVRTNEPGQFTAALVRESLDETGAEPSGLEIVRPSLEDIYLSLIGESGRVTATASAADAYALAEPTASTPASAHALAESDQS